MSLTVQDIVLEAKNLVAKLKERNSETDNMIYDAHLVDRQIDSMNQHSDEKRDLKDIINNRPLSSFIGSIQQENCPLKDLQKENRELRDALEERQAALELIMSKYREHVSSLILQSKVDVTKFDNQESIQTILDQSLRISEMAGIMEMAARVDEPYYLKYDEELSRLTSENEGLRNLLRISSEYGSINSNNSNQTA